MDRICNECLRKIEALPPQAGVRIYEFTKMWHAGETIKAGKDIFIYYSDDDPYRYCNECMWKANCLANMIW